MKWSPFAAIAVVFIAGWVLVTPWRNVPVIDDWVYAWSVEHLLRTRELRVSDFSSIYPIAQILWGALFAGVTGFSFGILRLSTVVLAFFGCSAIYLTLLELEIDPRVSLVAALTVALSPVYFALSFTFMTDVPFVALCSIALFCYVSALVRDEPRRLWWGGLAAMLAFFIRPIGVMLPLSVAAGVHPHEWKTAARQYGPPLVLTVAAMIAGWLAMPIVFGRLPIADSRIQDLSYLALVSPRTYADWNLNLPIITAFPFAPMLFALLLSRRRALTIGAVAAALAVMSWALLGHLATPLPDWQTWSLQDLATRGGLIGGDLQPSAWSVRAAPWIAIAGIVAAACLFVGVASVRFRVRRGMLVLLAFALLHVLLFNLLWFFNDRYYLVLAPALAYFAAAPFAGGEWNRRLLWVAAPMLVLWGFVSVTGTRDMLATNDTVARLTRDLEAQGIPPYDIDAGYALNGWRLYVHPENLPLDADRRYSVPFVTSSRPTRYAIVNAPGPGEEVLREEPLPAALWQVSNRVYVVRRKAPAAAPAAER